jgi:pimeloyl-ACP methyl ester carboxylesterase
MRQREDVPAGSEGWNLIYVTEGVGGRLVYVSGEIYIPIHEGAVERRVALWNHPTAGMSDACAPSWGGDPSVLSAFGFERTPLIGELLHRGHVVIMSDYQGLGTPGGTIYMDGSLAAKASLDAVRAARKFAPARAGADFVSYGHSQGGQTTLWTAALVGAYAPELRLRGALSISPAVDTLALTRWDIANPPLGAYVVMTAAGLSVSNPHLRLRDILTPAGLELLATMSDVCFATRAAAERIEEPLIREEALARGQPWREVMEKNGDFYSFGASAPILIVQGDQDFDVPAQITRTVVARMRKAKMNVDYREIAGRDHFSIVPEASRIGRDWLNYCLDA